MYKGFFVVSYSANNKDVYDLSLQNHCAYCARHNYKLVSINEPYNPFIDTARVRKFILEFPFVVVLGADIIIRRFSIPVESFIDRPGITMCHEYGGGVLNGDFIIFTATSETHSVLDALDELQPRIENGQSALNVLYNRKLPGINAREYMQIAAPRMNPHIDYSGVDFDKYFSIHYHTMGRPPTPAIKAEAMRQDLMLGKWAKKRG